MEHSYTLWGSTGTWNNHQNGTHFPSTTQTIEFHFSETGKACKFSTFSCVLMLFNRRAKDTRELQELNLGGLTVINFT